MASTASQNRARSDIASIVLLLALATAGCTKPELVVVLDGWWNADFAKNSCTQAKKWYEENAALITQFGCAKIVACPEMMRRFEACIVDPVQEVRQFEIELATQFAADPHCNGVRFVSFKGPTDNPKADEAMQGPYFMLGLDFEPGALEQHWWMVKMPDRTITQGLGNPKDILDAVCSIVKERGAKLLN
jgi:hypothetical protein